MGLGHVSRSVSIAREVQKRGGKVLFSTYLEGVEYVSKQGLPVVESPEIFLETDENFLETIKLDIIQGHSPKQ